MTCQSKNLSKSQQGVLTPGDPEIAAITGNISGSMKKKNQSVKDCEKTTTSIDVYLALSGNNVRLATRR